MDLLFQIGLGVLGASLGDFLMWDIDDFVNAFKGYKTKEANEWEKVRMISYYTLISFNGSDKIDIDMVRMPGDPPPSYKNKKKAKMRWLNRT